MKAAGLDNPNQAAFSTSERLSNEATFPYQLFGRELGPPILSYLHLANPEANLALPSPHNLPAVKFSLRA
jgi:hypothetical protein